jgi:excisionase family DNA binding protein
MTSNVPPPRRWLSLQQAAQLLGIHPITLRRWVDNGQIPCMVTPGGHRRFDPCDIEQAAQKHIFHSRQASLEAEWEQKALLSARSSLQDHRLAAWQQGLSEDEREIQRRLGRRLMGLILHRISSPDREDLSPGLPAWTQEARSIAREYRHLAERHGLPLSAVMEAALVFRDAMVESAVLLPRSAHNHSEGSIRLLRHINTVLNEVILSIIDTAPV